MATRKANIHDNVIEDNSRAVDINHHIEVENKYMPMAQRLRLMMAKYALVVACDYEI